MRNIFSVLVTLTVLGALFTSCKRRGHHGDRDSSHKVLITNGQYAVGDITQVIATTSGGNIEVLGDATDKATVDVYGSFNSNDSIEILSKIKQYYDLNITQDNHTLHLTAKQKRNFNMGLFSHHSGVAIHFVVHVQKDVINILETSGGNIHLAKVSGSEQKVHTSGGNLNIENVKGNIEGETAGGNIDFSSLEGDKITLHTSGGNIDGTEISGVVDLETKGGNITIEKGKGKYTLETSGGNVEANNIEGTLKMSTSGGNILANHIAGGVIGSTSGGNIEASFSIINSDIELENSGGGIRISIPKNAKINLNIKSEELNTSNLNNFSGKLDKHTINGALNGGGTKLSANNNGGAIELNLE